MTGWSTLYTFCVDDGGRVIRIVAIDTVNNKVVVFRTIAIGTDGEEAAAGISLDAGAKRDKVLEIAPIEWKIVDLFIAERAAEGIAGGVEKRRFFGNEDRVGNRARTEIKVEGDIFGDLKFYISAFGSLKTFGFGPDPVFARSEVADEVLTRDVSDGGTRNATIRIGDGDSSSTNGAAGVILDGT